MHPAGHCLQKRQEAVAVNLVIHAGAVQSLIELGCLVPNSRGDRSTVAGAIVALATRAPSQRAQRTVPTGQMRPTRHFTADTVVPQPCQEEEEPRRCSGGEGEAAGGTDPSYLPSQVSARRAV